MQGARRRLPFDDPGAAPPLRFPERRFSPIRNIGLRILVAVLALVFVDLLR